MKGLNLCYFQTLKAGGYLLSSVTYLTWLDHGHDFRPCNYTHSPTIVEWPSPSIRCITWPQTLDWQPAILWNYGHFYHEDYNDCKTLISFLVTVGNQHCPSSWVIKSNKEKAGDEKFSRIASYLAPPHPITLMKCKQICIITSWFPHPLTGIMKVDLTISLWWCSEYQLQLGINLVIGSNVLLISCMRGYIVSCFLPCTQPNLWP